MSCSQGFCQVAAACKRETFPSEIVWDNHNLTQKGLR